MEQHKRNPKVLVTGGSSSIAFNIVRCIREVFPNSWIGVVDSLPYGPCFHIDLVDQRWILPQFNTDPEGYLKLTLEVIQHSEADVVLAGADHDVLVLAHLRTALAKYGQRVLVPDAASVAIANSKQLTCHFAQQHRIPQPRYVIAQNEDEAEEFSREVLPSLSVVKEISTINAIAPTPVATRELASWFRECFGSPVLIQEFVSGLAISVTTVVLPSGDILEPVAMQKIATDGHGETIEGIVVEARNIKQRSNRVLQLLNWIGPAEVEWIVDERDHSPKLLEINSRFPAWIYLTHWKGRNLPSYCVEYACRMAALPPEPPPPGLAFCRQPFDIVTMTEELYCNENPPH